MPYSFVLVPDHSYFVVTGRGVITVAGFDIERHRSCRVLGNTVSHLIHKPEIVLRVRISLHGSRFICQKFLTKFVGLVGGCVGATTSKETKQCDKDEKVSGSIHFPKLPEFERPGNRRRNIFVCKFGGIKLRAGLGVSG